MEAAVSTCTRQDPNLLNVIRRTLMCVNCKASLLNEPGPRPLISRDAISGLDHCARAGFVVRNKVVALVLSAGLFSVQAQAAGDAEAGATLFKRICGGCHQVAESARGSFGIFWGLSAPERIDNLLAYLQTLQPQ